MPSHRRIAPKTTDVLFFSRGILLLLPLLPLLLLLLLHCLSRCSICCMQRKVLELKSQHNSHTVTLQLFTYSNDLLILPMISRPQALWKSIPNAGFPNLLPPKSWIHSELRLAHCPQNHNFWLSTCIDMYRLHCEKRCISNNFLSIGCSFWLCAYLVQSICCNRGSQNQSKSDILSSISFYISQCLWHDVSYG